MAAVTGKDAAAVLNDIYACASSKPEASVIAAARTCWSNTVCRRSARKSNAGSEMQRMG